MNYWIYTDSTADLPESYCEEHKIRVLALQYTMDGKTYGGDVPVMEATSFYAAMRAGSVSVTSQLNPEFVKEKLKPVVAAGENILYLSFSSGLSGSYQSVCIAANDLKQEFPNGGKILVVDTKCASLGQGLLVDRAVKNRDAGMTLEENGEKIEACKMNLVHMFTVDSLTYLKRGGRISATTAVLGTILNIKPVMHMDDAGKLVALSKVRGRKKALDELVHYFDNKQLKGQNEEVFISHGDCLADAEYVANVLKEKYGVKSALIGNIGPVIGSHSGPGTLALFFFGRDRHEID